MNQDQSKTDGAAAVSSTPLLGQLRDECHKALRCLYIAVDVPVADDVNAKVKAYITELERSASIRPNTELSGGGATDPQQQTEAESRRPLE